MKIAIGTAQLGLKYGITNPSFKMSKICFEKILNLSLKKKINLIDTAQSYGESEKIIGDFLFKKKYKNKFNVITKISNLRKIKRQYLRGEIYKKIKESLNNLRIQKLYGVLLHDAKDLRSKKNEIIINTLLGLKKKRLIKKIGISCYNIRDIDYICSKYNVDIIQFPFNVFDQRLLDKKILNNLKKKKIEIHIRSIFLQGLLLLSFNKISIKYLRNHTSMKKWYKFLEINRINSVESYIGFIKKYNFYKNINVGFKNFTHIQKTIRCY